MLDLEQEIVGVTTTQPFGEFIEYLRENVSNLVEYRERTGTLDLGLLEVKEALYNEDPFIVFGATFAASLLLSDKSLYH